MSEAVTYSRSGHIGTIELCRPDNRNSMTPELLDAFSRASARAREDDDARVVVIRGSGTCFCAGADLRSAVQREARPGDRAVPTHERSYAMYEPFLTVLDIAVPVIGALNGHAVGGGFGLALLCDIRIGNQNSKYGANFARLGIHPGLAISYLLPRLVGVSRAAELLFTGRLIRGGEAERVGILSRAVPAKDVIPEALALAEEIARSGPNAVRGAKRAIYDGLAWDVRRAARNESYAQAASIDSDEFVEGSRALLEKRPPNF